MLIKHIHTCNLALCTYVIMHIQEEQGDYLLVLPGSREAAVEWWNGMAAAYLSSSLYVCTNIKVAYMRQMETKEIVQVNFLDNGKQKNMSKSLSTALSFKLSY